MYNMGLISISPQLSVVVTEYRIQVLDNVK